MTSLMSLLTSAISAWTTSGSSPDAASIRSSPVLFAMAWFPNRVKNFPTFFIVCLLSSLRVHWPSASQLSISFSSIPRSTAGVVSAAPRNMLYSHVLTQLVAMFLAVSCSRSMYIIEVFPVPHSPWRPTVIGVSLWAIKLVRARA